MQDSSRIEAGFIHPINGSAVHTASTKIAHTSLPPYSHFSLFVGESWEIAACSERSSLGKKEVKA
jgi:hypothetical protein